MKYHVCFSDNTVADYEAAEARVGENVTRVTITPAQEPDWAAVRYLDFDLHPDIIRAGDGGYAVLPKGVQDKNIKNSHYALCEFREREDAVYLLRDLQMPVFGLKHGENARVIVVTGMKYDVGLVVTISGGTYTFRARVNIGRRMPFESIVLEIHTLAPGATYSDMAREYRNYQLSHGFRAIRERLTPELAYCAESANIRIRMGWKPVPCTVAEQTEENEPPVHVACNYDEIIELMKAYRDAGVKKAEFCLVGFNKGGHDGRWPQILPPEEAFGGAEGLSRTIAAAKSLGYAMTCHTNSTDGYTIAKNLRDSDIARKANGEKSVQATYWGGGRTYNICPKRALALAKETLPAVASLGFRGMHYVDVITATPPRECFSPEHPMNKKESSEAFDELFAFCQKEFGAVGSESAFDYSMKHCDFTLYVAFQSPEAILAAPHPLCDRLIPFWQLVYHGIVLSNPFSKTVNIDCAENRDDLLKVIEYGGKPQFYYYSHFTGNGNNWISKKDFACNTDAERRESAATVKAVEDIFAPLAYLQYEFMEKHEQTAPGVFRVTYSDGSVVTVDYNAHDFTLTRGQKQ